MEMEAIEELELEVRDIAKLNKAHPLLDIVEVAYDKNGEVCAFAVRRGPEPFRLDCNWYGDGYVAI